MKPLTGGIRRMVLAAAALLLSAGRLARRSTSPRMNCVRLSGQCACASRFEDLADWVFFVFYCPLLITHPFPDSPHKEPRLRRGMEQATTTGEQHWQGLGFCAHSRPRASSASFQLVSCNNNTIQNPKKILSLPPVLLDTYVFSVMPPQAKLVEHRGNIVSRLSCRWDGRCS